VVDTRSELHDDWVNMERETIIEILNELFALEAENLLPRIAESTVFISWASTDDARVVERMIVEDRENRALLASTIRDIGGEILPVWGPIDSGNMHFLDLGFLLPRVVEDHRRLVEAYESAAPQVSAVGIAAEVVGKIAECHRGHTEQLSALASHHALAAS
jgi:hypothetical protein